MFGLSEEYILTCIVESLSYIGILIRYENKSISSHVPTHQEIDEVDNGSLEIVTNQDVIFA
jgi:hypothetical protein